MTKRGRWARRCVGGGDRGAVGGGLGQQHTGGLHCGLLCERHLMLLHENAPPRIDLLVDVDLHRADIGANCRLSDEANGRLLYFPRVEVGSMMRPIGPE